MYQTAITVRDGGALRLISYGHGAAYELQLGNNYDTLWFQGDDAIEFERTWRELEEARPTASTYTILRELWDLYYPR